MNKIVSLLCAGAMTLTSVAASTAGASAAGYQVPRSIEAGSIVQDVQYRDYRRDRGRFERRGDRYYYNGHRGYRHYRQGYREYNGWWFPGAAFVAGAIVGGALAQPPAPRYVPRQRYSVGLNQAHVDWCYSNYRSYREWDNSFQPYNGPRRECRSPYY